ncbi:MAG: response regulator [Candidatus Aminicenantes bacterium]|nr:response regulator [Candidatus Aminicenantes bacterium]
MDKQTILIVDDEKKIVELLKETITKMSKNYRILEAYNGKEALEKIDKEKIDLVLLDIKMPVMSGVQVLTELHNKKLWLPIIILTAYNVSDIEVNFREFGIVDYLSKPLDMVMLKSTIGQVLRNREQKDSITGMSLAAILQVLEMEQRTGVMTIKMEDKNGRIFFREGRVVDIEAGGLSVEEALGYLLDTEKEDEDREISIEYLNHKRTEKINKSLTEILLEASRILDEDRKDETAAEKEEEITEEAAAEIKKEKFGKLIELLKNDLGDALLSTQVWTMEGEILAGTEERENVVELFTQITVYLNEALSTSEFPELGNYYIFNLVGKKIVVTIPAGEYFWGMLIDSQKTPLGFLLKVVLSKLIDSFKEAIAA